MPAAPSPVTRGSGAGARRWWHALPRTRLRRALAAGAALVVLVVAVLIVRGSGSHSPQVRTSEQRIEVAGGPGVAGPISLDTTLYLPAAVPAPAVLLAHGFGGSKASVDGDARDLAQHGFVVLAYSARGFGASTGGIALDSLDYEVPDARALVDWLARRPEVQLDAPGDPRVGVTGASYGGALSLMLAGTDPRIDAVAPVITWNDLGQALFPNTATVATGSAGPTPAAAHWSPDGVFKKAWAASLIASVTTGTDLTAGATTAGVDNGDSGFGRSTTDATSASDAADPTGSTTAGAPAAPSAGAPTTTGTPVSPATSGSAEVAGSGGAPDTSTAGPPNPGTVTGAAAALGCGRLQPALCAAYAQAAQAGRLTPALQALLARSSPAAVVDHITAPTLLVQGEQDTLFGLDQADANARAIAAHGTTVALTWYNGGHSGGAPDQVTRDRITGWFTHYLRGQGPAPSTGFVYSVDGPLGDNGRARTRTLRAPAYPGLTSGSTPRADIALTGAPQTVANPPGGAPAGISSLPGLTGLVGTALSAVAGGLPGQTARFTSAPLSQLTVVAGTPRITVTVSRLPLAGAPAGSDGAVLFASLAKVGASGVRSLAGNAVAPIRLTALPADGSPATVTVDLPAVGFQIEAGSRVQIALSTTDQAYAGPTAPAAYRIALAGNGALDVPEVDGVRVSAGGVPVVLLIGVVLLAVVAVVLFVLGGRVGRRARPARARPPATDAADAPPPLVITGLGKSYPGGVAAVTDVGLTVERGQVLGLLGPNGAGKTTTLRMVMGLITPTAGEIRVFGEPIRPGAEILARIGSFVEGSGFLPHLSGRANLELFWRSTGRPAGDAHLTEALEIAGLGAAVRRRVKTYSQGMRQRLAIAQAMLGLPDLLLLDEPTNGLDPPQIHAMREVLRGYAATGRTVVVSSHLLSEVEQTCSHVVVVHQGRTIASGTVAEMVAAGGDRVFTVGDVDRAVQVLRALPGVSGVERAGDGAVAAAVDPDRVAGAVTALVGAGVAVSGVAPRHRLEDVFLDLIGAGSSAGGSV